MTDNPMGMGDFIEAGSTFRHVITDVKNKDNKKFELTAFTITIKIKNHPKKYNIRAYCSIFKSNNELELEEGDYVSINRIDRIQIGSSSRGSLFIYAILGDINIYKKDSDNDEDPLLPPGPEVFREPLPELVEQDEESPFPFDV